MTRRGLFAAALLVVASGTSLAVRPSLRDEAKAIAKQVVGFPAWLRRAAEPAEPEPFAHLAASQVGYASSHRKRFTAPAPFGSFSVVRSDDGAEIFRGGAPIGEVPTDLLGAAHSSVWIGDFSALDTPGRYRVVTDDGTSSHPFTIGDDVFAPAVRAVQRALYYQRAFTAIERPWAEAPWVHPSDAHLAPPGVEKGWHDAGDFSIYSATMTSTVFWLLEAQGDFAIDDDDLGIPESDNGVPDILDEARWGLGWFLSNQETGGGFRNTTCQTAYGPYGTNAPHTMQAYVAGEAGTLATARAVGLLGYAAVVYRPFDSAFADRCLEAARRGWNYLQKRPDEHSDGPTCPPFRLDGDAKVGSALRAFAAAGLLHATGETIYRDAFEATYRPIAHDPSYVNPGGYAALLYLRAAAGDPARKEAIRRELRTHADRALADGQAHPFGWATRYIWGSINAAFLRTGPFSIKTCLADPAGRDHCEQALANVHYLFGRNFLQKAHVSGLPGLTHGRERAFHHWLAALDATPFLFPGLVGSGPNAKPMADDVSYAHARPLPAWGYFGDPRFPRDEATPVEARLTDNDSWSTNELDIEWQATALYHLHFAATWR